MTDVRPPAPGNFLFTSESVNEGHPDKLCDQVSDAVLDACLAQDPDSRVACESCSKTGMVMVFGEITTKANVDYEAVVRKACQDIGYDDEAKGESLTMLFSNRVCTHITYTSFVRQYFLFSISYVRHDVRN